MVSVIILTKNEEKDLPACLESLRWCDDIHVVDSGSLDSTVEVAKSQGATVSTNPFSSFGEQRNWAIDHCSTKYEWILFLDADERSTPAFERVLKERLESVPEDVAGFYCCWKMMLGERWLKRSDNFPKWQFRLLRRGGARFIDVGHGQKEGVVNGRIEYIEEPYLHYAFSRGWEAWMDKHWKYARQEAKQRLNKPIDFANLFSAHGSKRNPAIKLLVGGLPGWPELRFIYSYLLKGGFLEGQEGLTYCQKIMWYEKQTQIEMRRLRSDRCFLM
jgi:glycosyltransferase involved in cell wall biosynthesis